jgi:cobalt/nickel transport system ATP-binding protein
MRRVVPSQAPPSIGRECLSSIEIRDLSYSYPDGTLALERVSLDVRSGERVALLGPNGAGKSTLLMHFNGILRGEGSIAIEGRHVTNEILGEIRARVGFVFQNPDDQLFSPSVREDVAFGPRYMGLDEGEIERRVERALNAVGMHDAINRMPHHLSIGQRKRVSLATVLSMDPTILVLDEPSAGLDPRARRELIRLLRELPQTTIISTHDMRLAFETTTRAVIMEQGSIVADGPTCELLADWALLERYGLELP